MKKKKRGAYALKKEEKRTMENTLPILDTLQKMTNSLLVIVDIPIGTKKLVRIKVSM
jgi:hypothetical protein